MKIVVYWIAYGYFDILAVVFFVDSDVFSLSVDANKVVGTMTRFYIFFLPTELILSFSMLLLAVACRFRHRICYFSLSRLI